MDAEKNKARCLLCASHLPTASAAQGQDDLESISRIEDFPQELLTPLPFLPAEPHGPHGQSQRGQSCSCAQSLPIPAAHRDSEHHPRRHQEQNSLHIAGERVQPWAHLCCGCLRALSTQVNSLLSNPPAALTLSAWPLTQEQVERDRL